jgi:hypothetical protein
MATTLFMFAAVATELPPNFNTCIFDISDPYTEDEPT